MNIMFISDIHILDSDILEINEIFAEILSIVKNSKIDKLIIAGDTFDKARPTSKELDCFATFLQQLNIPVICIVADSHESTTPENSVLNHFGILNNNITCVKEYINGDLFVGHFIVNQSKYNYGGSIDKESLKQYKNVILGHGHMYELIKPNIIQLGSCRFVDFGEDENIPKKAAICFDYEKDKPTWRFFNLKSYYPLINIELDTRNKNKPIIDDVFVQENAKESDFSRVIHSVSELLGILDTLVTKNKIRVVFKDFDSYKQFIPYESKYTTKFYKFKTKKDFIISLNTPSSAKTESASLKEKFKNYLEVNKIPQEIQHVLLEELI